MHPRFLYDLDACSIRTALETVGDPWTLKILREAVYGLTRFDDFARALACGRGVLSGRLKAMVTAGLMERRAYAEPGQRKRAEYHLTEKGWDLFPALLALSQWSERWTPPPDGPVAKVSERASGRPVRVSMTADPKAARLTMDEVRVQLGPGARRIA
ncbi:winged helix-turn-helix transcriptional regulator [Phenylobacterium sp.]|uniref:winged helix-turn-helix transcriptional regulator n=1 Tax=Phenylobacterium sp. TaxID=1871053 RepID=UPI003561BFCD